jgi:hypothetical protein
MNKFIQFILESKFYLYITERIGKLAHLDNLVYTGKC